MGVSGHFYTSVVLTRRKRDGYPLNRRLGRGESHLRRHICQAWWLYRLSCSGYLHILCCRCPAGPYIHTINCPVLSSYCVVTLRSLSLTVWRSKTPPGVPSCLVYRLYKHIRTNSILHLSLTCFGMTPCSLVGVSMNFLGITCQDNHLHSQSRRNVKSTLQNFHIQCSWCTWSCRSPFTCF
jgi:hypothetical protein